jgi:hypothetical protein
VPFLWNYPLVPAADFWHPPPSNSHSTVYTSRGQIQVNVVKRCLGALELQLVELRVPFFWNYPLVPSADFWHPPPPIVTVQFTLRGAKFKLALSSAALVHLNFNLLNLGVPFFRTYHYGPSADFWHPPF